jgi:tRNA(Ile)-lysidine synthase TilS/MesJ
LDRYVVDLRRIAAAFSGGKDSTLLSPLLLDQVLKRGRSDLSIVLVHNDTQSEIPENGVLSQGFHEYLQGLR